MSNSINFHAHPEFRQFLARLTHEIRNPLSIIDSELQILADTHPELTQYRDWEIVMDHLNYLEDLLNDFSAYRQAEDLTLVPTPFREYLLHLTDSIRPTLQYLGIQLLTDIPESLPTLPIDRIKLRQAFLNLIRNAEQAVPDKEGIIKISCRQTSGQGICLTIQDNGSGISPEQLPNIFTPFITYKPDGTGLGLPIAQQIVKAHGGTLEADSLPGQETTFRLFLG